MNQLKQILREEFTHYYGNGHGAGLRLFRLIDEERHEYTLLSIRDPREHNTHMRVVFMARIVGEYIVIEEDSGEWVLLEALLSRGVPRGQIIFAYNGETLPTSDPVEASE